jgi:peptidoglycan/LPS O-acetylase OafA/YrhL
MPDLKFIGSLRGLAGLWILLYHAHFLPTPNPSRPLWAGIFVDVGGMAVMLFFVISAFSLMYTYPNRLKSSKPILDFYIHRFFRIVPLFYLVLCYYIVWDKFRLDYQHPFATIFSNLTLTFNLIPNHQTAIVWAGWSIGVEVLFYLIFPFVYRLCGSLLSSLNFLILTLIFTNLFKALVPYVIQDPKTLSVFQQWFFLRYLPVFALGIVVFRIWQTRMFADLSGKSKTSLGCFLVLLSAFLLLSRPAVLATLLGDDLYSQALAFSCLVLGLSLVPLKALVNPILGWFGKLSYSVYLLQPIVIWQMQPLTTSIYTELGNTIGFFVSTLLIVFSLSLVAWASERLIERPMIQLGKKLSRAIAV